MVKCARCYTEIKEGDDFTILAPGYPPITEDDRRLLLCKTCAPGPIIPLDEEAVE